MLKFYYVLLSGCIMFLLIQPSLSGVTLEQYTEAGKMMRSICESKFKLTPEQEAQLDSKQTPDDKSIKCYVNCIFETSKAMKRGKYNLEIALKQIDMMVPDDLKEEYKNGMAICKDSGKGLKDYCDISYEFYKCLIKEIPNLIVP